MQVPYLDVSISPEGPAPVFPVGTTLFDKRWSYTFDIIKFPHATSKLSARSKYGIVTSQFHRFRRILTDFDDFCKSNASVISDLRHRGYDTQRCILKLASLLRSYPGIYPYDPQFLLARVHHHLAAF